MCDAWMELASGKLKLHDLQHPILFSFRLLLFSQKSRFRRLMPLHRVTLSGVNDKTTTHQLSSQQLEHVASVGGTAHYPLVQAIA